MRLRGSAYTASAISLRPPPPIAGRRSAMYEKESAVESKARGGGANTFMDESFQGYPHLLDEETGKFSRSTTPGLRVYCPGTMGQCGLLGKALIHYFPFFMTRPK